MNAITCNHIGVSGAKIYVMRCDIIEQLRKLGCNKLVLGEYKAIVGQFGFVLNYVSKDGIKHEVRWKENDEINITEIVDDNCFLSGDLVPSFVAHKRFFKGIVKRSKSINLKKREHNY